MEILASCSLSEAVGYRGKLVIPNEDSKRPDKVFLNIVVGEDEEKSEAEIYREASLLDSVRCITFLVDEDRVARSVPEEWKGRVFNEYSCDFYEDANAPDTGEAVALLRLPEGYSNMRVLREKCTSDPRIRYIGGNLLGIEGVRIGRFDEGKEKMPPVFKDMYDTFVEVSLNDLDGLQEIVKKTRKRAESIEGGKRSPRVAKPKRAKRGVEAFRSLFGEEEEEF